jgi:hypothetical protein
VQLTFSTVKTEEGKTVFLTLVLLPSFLKTEGENIFLDSDAAHLFHFEDIDREGSFLDSGTAHLFYCEDRGGENSFLDSGPLAQLSEDEKEKAH